VLALGSIISDAALFTAKWAGGDVGCSARRRINGEASMLLTTFFSTS
jgi:hypothetical protein